MEIKNQNYYLNINCFRVKQKRAIERRIQIFQKYINQPAVILKSEKGFSQFGTNYSVVGDIIINQLKFTPVKLDDCPDLIKKYIFKKYGKQNKNKIIMVNPRDCFYINYDVVTVFFI